ncbi:MAG: hypothetical protein ACFFAS_07100 [Promethearchaeota archaeon]
MAYNATGSRWSNELEINVEISSDDNNSILGYDIFLMVGAIGAVSCVIIFWQKSK